MSDIDRIAALLDEHTPWARAEFRAFRLWMACYCGWNAMGDSDGTWNDHFIAAGVTLDPTPPDAPARCNHWPGQPRCEVCGMTAHTPPDALTLLEMAEFDERTEGWKPVYRERIRAFLDPRPAPDAALDVKRLARALRSLRDEFSTLWWSDEFAAAIAREYAALGTTP